MTLRTFVPTHSDRNRRGGTTSSCFCLFTDAVGCVERTVDDTSRAGRLPVSVTDDDVAA
jgi:hypothetical protein